MFVRAAILLFLTTAFACAAASAEPASSEDGVFDAGPYRMAFFATQGAAEERYRRQIPSFGPTQLNVQFVGPADAAPAVDFKDLDVEVQLLWGKNELLPPKLLETHHMRGESAISFEHAFDEDGKYIVSVVAREPNGAQHLGRHIFFVIQTADPHLFVSSLAVAFILGFIYLVWRQRRKPSERKAGRR